MREQRARQELKRAPRKWNRPDLAANAGAGEAFVANLRASLAQIGANATGAAAGRDPEYLHQLRVGIRRLRSVLRTFRELLRRRGADAIDRQWRAIMHTLGSARDWDLFHRTLDGGELRREADQRRRETQRLARALVKSPRFRKVRSATFAWARQRPWRRHADAGERLPRFARQALDHLHARLCKAAQGINWRDAGRRHRVRIRVKRMRYACDFFAAAFRPRRMRAFLDRLHSLQDLLGELNDIQVQRVLMRGLARGGRPLRDPATPLAVRARLEARERGLIAALEPAWAAFEARRPFWRHPEAARARG